MAEETQTLSAHHATAERQRTTLETLPSSSTPTFQTALTTAISAYIECQRLATALALFSPNEPLDDISTPSLKYLLLHFRIGELTLRINGTGHERRDVLLRGRGELERFLGLVDNYGILGREEQQMLERYEDNKGGFTVVESAEREGPRSTATGVSSAAERKRESKIRRFREERALRGRLEHLNSNPRLLETSDETLRSLHLTEISYAIHQTFAHLESIALELHMLSLAPSPETLTNGHPTPQNNSSSYNDTRDRTHSPNNSSNSEYSDRLDPSLSSLLQSNKAGGPILSPSGRPIRPFTLTDTRQRLMDGVFRPDHSLPSMSIDEYLAEERRRGGIIGGGGNANSGDADGGGERRGGEARRNREMDGESEAKADRATYEARAWDEFKEANPRGSGNTMNMG